MCTTEGETGTSAGLTQVGRGMVGFFRRQASMRRKTFTSILVPGVSALVLGISIALLWVVVLRETSRKDLLLEYEAFRASSALADEYRRDQSFSPSVDKRVLGFGFFRIDGAGLQVYGSAPSKIAIPAQFSSDRTSQRGPALQGMANSHVENRGRSIVLIRYSGLQNPLRPMGMGQGMGRNRSDPSLAPPWPAAPQGGQGTQSLQGPQSPQGSSLLPALFSPHFIWIEYSAQDYGPERVQSFIVASLVSLALLAFYFLFLGMFRKNELLAAQELESRELVQLGEAARTLVHEIKNPLGIMRIQTARIRKGLGEDGSAQGPEATASARAAAGIIDGEIRRLSDLADRIREFLKSGAAKVEALDLSAFLKDFSERYASLEASGIDFTLELPAVPAAFAEADRDKLVIVLDNLVGNAIEAVHEAPQGERKIRLRLFEQDRNWSVAVLDSGHGVDLSHQGRIFTPFFTTKEKGSGIGLSLARRFAESFGATLVLESQGSAPGAVFVLRMRGAKPPRGDGL